MPAYRYYNESLEKGQTAQLEGSEFEHLSKVMRQREGDLVELTNGRGLLAYARITQLEKKKAHFEIEKTKVFSLEHSLILYQALPLWSHLEWIVEKGVELGMTKLILFKAAQSTVPFSEKKRQRLEIKAISALKQSGRVFLPEILYVDSQKALPVDSSLLFFGDLRDNAPLFDLSVNRNPLSSIAFASGPEAGFSQDEIEWFEEKRFQGVQIHSNILRAETAPLTFLSLAHHKLMLKSNAPLVN